MCGVVQAGSKLLQTRTPALITLPHTPASHSPPKAPAANGQHPGAAAAAAAAGGSGGSSGSSPKLPARGSKGSSSPGSKQHQRASSSGGGGGSGGSSSAANAAAAAGALIASHQHACFLAGLMSEVHKLLCMGVLRVQLALPLLGMCAPPALCFNGQAQRYDQRFAHFHTLQRPDPLQYEQYVAATDVSRAPPARLLQLAADNFHRVRLVCGGAWALAWAVVVRASCACTVCVRRVRASCACVVGLRRVRALRAY
jgi:hypothetical protein